MAKQNWEILYEDMKNNNFKMVKDDLKSRKNNTETIQKEWKDENGVHQYDVTKRNEFTMDDYKKLKMYEAADNNYEKVEKNLKKVGNLIEYRDFLIKKKEELDRYINQHITSQMSENQIQESLQKLDKERAQLQEKRKDLDRRLEEAAKEPNEVKRADIEAEIRSEIRDTDRRVRLNDNEYTNILKENEQTSEVKKDIKTNKFSRFSLDELKVKSKEIENKVKDCNVACEMLMEGKEWNEIDTRLTNINSVKEKETTERKRTENVENILNTKLEATNKNPSSKVEKTEKETKGTSSTETSLIEKPKGLWARIKGRIKSFVDKYLKEDDELESELEKSTEDEIKEELKQEEKKNDSFKDKIEVSKENENQYDELKEIAEKGWKKVKTEKLANKNKENVEIVENIENEQEL